MYVVKMKFEDDNNWYFYGSWEDRNKANEVAMEVRETRNCETIVEEEK